jgi:TRL-like protein family
VKKLVSAAVALAALISTGCAGLPYMNRPVIGAAPTIYASTGAPEMITDAARVTGKSGQACSTSILGIVTTGEATVSEAARRGNIHRVTYSENTFLNVVGIYSRYCVIVVGE